MMLTKQAYSLKISADGRLEQGSIRRAVIFLVAAFVAPVRPLKQTLHFRAYLRTT